jgi:hypothetical protein
MRLYPPTPQGASPRAYACSLTDPEWAVLQPLVVRPV